MNRLLHSSWSLLIPLIFYFGGMILCPPEDIQPLQGQGYAEQKEYSWVGKDGEEHNGLTLIKINGIGHVFTYNDIYGSAIALFIPFLIIGKALYGKNQDELKSIVFGNCVIGLLLIGLSAKSHVASTIMFWVGIISANYINNSFKQVESSNYD